MALIIVSCVCLVFYILVTKNTTSDSQDLQITRILTILSHGGNLYQNRMTYSNLDHLASLTWYKAIIFGSTFTTILRVPFTFIMCWISSFRYRGSFSYSDYSLFLVEHILQQLTEKGQMGGTFQTLINNLIGCRMLHRKCLLVESFIPLTLRFQCYFWQFKDIIFSHPFYGTCFFLTEAHTFSVLSVIS